MINDQPPIPPLRQLYDERCAGGLAVTACYTTKWDVIYLKFYTIHLIEEIDEFFINKILILYIFQSLTVIEYLFLILFVLLLKSQLSEHFTLW